MSTGWNGALRCIELTRMKIRFLLVWGRAADKKFKSPDAFGLYQEYLHRINRFLPTTTEGISNLPSRKPRVLVWVCDRTAKPASSEEVAAKLERAFSQGVSELCIAIGPPDGFRKNEDLESSDWIWSFGTMTLPHELAAVVAAEQFYRALTILKKLPYHQGH